MVKLLFLYISEMTLYAAIKVFVYRYYIMHCIFRVDPFVRCLRLCQYTPRATKKLDMLFCL